MKFIKLAAYLIMVVYQLDNGARIELIYYFFLLKLKDLRLKQTTKPIPFYLAKKQLSNLQ